jgi:hypothetical protein
MRLRSLNDPQKLKKGVARLRKSVRHRFLSPVPTRALFIFGKQRSGTSMTMDALELHPDTEVYDEARDSIAFLDYRIRSLERIRRILEDSRAPVTCFKTLADSHLIRDFVDTFPECRCIWLHRDFEDVANSSIRMFEQSDRAIRIACEGGSGGGWFQEGLSPRMLEVLRRVYRPDLSKFELSCLVWWARNEIAREQRIDELDNVMFLKYEHLVTRGVDEIRRVLEFAGLRFLPAVVAHVHTRSIRKNPPPPMDPAIESLCAELSRWLDRVTDAQALRSR